MITKKDLIEAFARNNDILQMQTKGLTHSDSVIQLPFRGNCLNWTLGHITASLNTVLQLLGEPGVLAPEQAALYEYGSEPVTCNQPGILPLEELLAIVDQAQEKLAAALENCSESDLEREVQAFGRTMTVGQAVFFQYFHVTYHTGQTELLRQLTGVNDKVI